MGWFDGSSVISSSTHGHSSHRKHSSSSKHRSHSRSGISILGGDSKHHSSTTPRASSIFGVNLGPERTRGASSIFGGGDSHKHNASRSSFFSGTYPFYLPYPPRSAPLLPPHQFSLLHQPTNPPTGFGGARSSSSSYYKRSPRTPFLKRMYEQLRRLLRSLIRYMKRNPIKVFILVIMPLVTGGALTALLAKFGLRLPPGVERMFGALAGKKEVSGRRGGGMTFERETVETKGGFDFGNAMGGIGGAVSLAKMLM